MHYGVNFAMGLDGIVIQPHAFLLLSRNGSVGLCIWRLRTGIVSCRSVRQWHRGRLGLAMTHCSMAIGRHVADGSTTFHYTLHSVFLRPRFDSPRHIEIYHRYINALCSPSIATSVSSSIYLKR